ncbi:glycoside hydrolase [Aspergillus avenaceus]|uniref:Glycoside hydrolase n=1 Tax=Aspergillus avenaceus TaxID=36643 RepID=A0A5N6TZI6_ASPAV|nr:glycoside hydrolase [Aspergillus avenaceus]
MKALSALTLFSSWTLQARASAVFAHFMVGNTESYSQSQWKEDITLARDAHIDAFALNMAHSEIFTDSIATAFKTAQDLDFKLFFSFDYAGNGSWPKKDTIDLMNQYRDHAAYYRHKDKPLLSTFEGGDSRDWAEIRNKTDSFFVPDWSSLGPEKAANRSYIDGLFSWSAWPEGPRRMNTSADDAYIKALDGKPYMMPVSPWFYTNMPGFKKNWVWRGDNLWFDRWQQVMDLQPEFVQIISWNDYGESHYIGPRRDDGYEAFGRGKAPFNYAKDIPHDGWRTFLPFLIDGYKKNSSAVAVDQEDVVTWYRLHPAAACSTGGTTGNAKVQGQKEYKPGEILEDRIFYSALLKSSADVSVKIGKQKLTGKWENVPRGGSGLYHGSVPFKSTGDVKVTVSRDGDKVASVSGEHITDRCPDLNGKDYQNYNAWVGTSVGTAIGLSVGMAIVPFMTLLALFIS